MRIKASVSLLIFVFVAAICLADSNIAANDKLTPKLRRTLSTTVSDVRHKVWVYFKDKDESSPAFAKAGVLMSPKALRRRINIPVDRFDLPVKREYIDRINSIGGENVRPSKWLNAVSARLTVNQILRLAESDFVRKIDIVAVLKRSPAPAPSPPVMIPPPVDSADYGHSFIQNHMLGIDSLHQLKVYDGNDSIPLDGAGVLIAFLDSGYEINHPAFDSMDIIDTYDFINDDADVDDDLPTSRQVYHGTLTLSACGAYVPGQLIGPAYGASFALYKTEVDGSETQIEEDNWVLAAERADSVGADIISTSLGYNDWYTYEDMDGNTAVTAVAADIAASRGILVVVSAGNEGNKAWHYIIAPADGDSVVAVGAVTADETIVAFSSFGPSFDGRVKPELVAMGSGVWSADYTGGFTSASGTSMACPLISGSAALILQANQSLVGNPMALRERLIKSGNRYPNPDPDYRYGFGLPEAVIGAGFGLKIHPVSDIVIAVGLSTEVPVATLAPVDTTVTFEPVDFPPSIIFTDHGDGTGLLSITGDIDVPGTRAYRLAASAGIYSDTLEFLVTTVAGDRPFFVGPNPFRESLKFSLARTLPGGYVIEIFSLPGELVFRHTGADNLFIWDGINDRGQKVASGVYIIRFSADGIDEKVKVFKL
jgi:serine protease AprX